jgi:AAA domain-containing protein
MDAHSKGFANMDGARESSGGSSTNYDQRSPAPTTPPKEQDPAVADFLSVMTWANLDIPPEVRLLSDFITTSTRCFLSGTTGIGKTMFIYGMVAGMASGAGFLHWTCDRKSKWLIIDGEMPKGLVKVRSVDLLRRAGGQLAIPPHNVTIYSRDREDDFVAAFPHLGRMSALNTEPGTSSSPILSTL